MSTDQKILINCQDGLNNIERATVAFIIAVTASKTKETAMFLSAEAADLCVKGATRNVVATGYEPLQSLIDAYIVNGGKLWLCPACVKAKGISESDLLDQVEIAGAPRAMEFLAQGAQLLA